MGSPQSISESSTSTTTTTQNWTDSFNTTNNNVRNLENVGNISLGEAGMPAGSGKASSNGTSGIPWGTIVISIVAGLAVVFIMRLIRKKL